MKNNYEKYQDKHEEKSPYAKREEEILEYWNKNEIFKKSDTKDSTKGEFVFYEGPPTANGRPGIHHLVARAFKDALPRYKTMQGFHVRRKGGWDTHGLPVELQVEKQLGLKSKLEIEDYGIEAFNQKCKESVWEYKSEWEDFTRRIGYWVDLDNPYVTYHTNYIESLWWIVKQVSDKGLLYKDYKVVPWCSRCGTTLSSHELAQGYADVKDISIYAKFKAKNPEKFGLPENTYLLAWTTTPWTLPGNVALAVGSRINYDLVQKDGEYFIVAHELRDKITPASDGFVPENSFAGAQLLGLEYEPLFPYFKELAEKEGIKNLENAYKVYGADFVTTTDGTGIVHTAVMYGQDDFELGTKVGLPKMHIVKEDGTYVDGMGEFSGRFVKEETDGKPTLDIDVIKYLQEHGTFFEKEKYEHSYPHCWRCKTPLLYYARDSWYINMQEVKAQMIAENQTINWEPSHIKDGRFGEWLKDMKDWAISRERYWGTPLPIWQAEDGELLTVGSIEDLKTYSHDKVTRVIFVRHGESVKNVENRMSSTVDKHPLTRKGEKVAKEAGQKLKDFGVDVIYSSPVLRAKQTADIIAGVLGMEVQTDERISEIKSGEWEEKTLEEIATLPCRDEYLNSSIEERYKTKRGKTGESWEDVENRLQDFLAWVQTEHRGKTIVVVSHQGTNTMGMKILKNLTNHEADALYKNPAYIGHAKPISIYTWSDTKKEIDLHRPFIDDVVLEKDGKTFTRVKEVMDVWFDSGSMPFAQDHYPFENKEFIDRAGVPADFISEGMDQTRGWFYTLHAVANLLGKGKAYKNVISLGLVNDANGQKMSKSKGNTVNPWDAVNKFGVDSVRFWMYSVNGPGESKNFDEKTITETQRKVFGLLDNVVKFYEMYAGDVDKSVDPAHSPNVLDKWILERIGELENLVTEKMDSYQLLEPTRAIRDFIGDLSQWYIRRSRDRFKANPSKKDARSASGFRGQDESDRSFALATTRAVLERLSILMAPFTPFFAEDMYGRIGGEKESVHLESWPEAQVKTGFFQKPSGKKLVLATITPMQKTRSVISEALELRSKANINVRQPLASLTITEMLEGDYLELIANELNVKEVVIGPELALDTEITPELEKEGDMRELIRQIQAMRKDADLHPEDRVRLTLLENQKDLYESFQDEFEKTAGVAEVGFGGEVKIDKM